MQLVYHCRRQGSWPVRDWNDLLQPALKGRLGFVEAPRDFIGVVMKTLGLSFNATAGDLEKHHTSFAQVLQRAKELKGQVKYSV